MNEELTALYEKYWGGFIEDLYKPNIGICSYPFIIQASTHYIHSSKRVMVCGQETKGWGDERENPDETSVLDMMHIYNSFVNCNNDGEPLQKPGYASPYWNFNRCLVQNHPDVGFVFQNVVKVGKYKRAGCDNNIYELTKRYFPVWQEELSILKPNIIIFLTGKYDWRIRQVVGEFSTTPVEGDIFLDELHFNNKAIPKAFRTNHPAYLQRKHRFFNVVNILSEIINSL